LARRWQMLFLSIQMKRTFFITFLALFGQVFFAQTSAKKAPANPPATKKARQGQAGKTTTKPATTAPATVVPASTADDNNPYVLAQKMPEYPNGGSEGMIEFIQEHLEYPMTEKQADIQGTILMQFIVEKDGSLSDIKAIKSVPNGENLEKEAARVIRMMPKWKPGMQDGYNVRVYKNVPFYFVLAKKKPHTTNHTNTHPHK
jgi:TonB family protein